MRECWAKSLGGCSGALTREHVFTRGLFDKKYVQAFGLPFLKGTPAEVSIDSVTVKALCAHHNSGFSELDEAVIDFACAIREFGRLLHVRADADRRRGRPYKWPSVTLPVDGLRLERWCMKTTINMWLTKHEDMTTWSAPREVLDAVAGVRSLPEGVGLGVLYDQQLRDSDSQQLEGSIGFAPLKKLATDEIGAGLFHFAGLMLICYWEHPIATLLPLRSEAMSADGEWHPLNFRFKKLNLGLRFDWTGKVAGPPIDRLRRERVVLAR